MESGFILNNINKILSFFQKKAQYLNENSFILKNIDNVIYATILAVFVASLALSSDFIGYIALITFILTIFKIFLKQGEQLEMNLFEKFLLIYFLFVIISLAGSTLFYFSLKGFSKTFIYLGFYLSTVQYFRKNTKRIPLTLGLIGICAAFEGAIGFIQNFASVDEISTWQDVTRINPEEVMTRVYGTLQPYNPNLFGGYLVATIPALFGMCFYFLLEKKYKFSIIALALAALTSMALILSGCRGAYIGLFVELLLFTGFLAKYIWDNKLEKIKNIFITTISSLFAAACCGALLITPIRARILSIFVMREDSSTSFRFNVYQSVIQMIKDNWLLGIGVGNQNFREIYGLYMRTGFDALSAYSIYLETFVESGIFALLAFLAFAFVLTKDSLSFIFSSKDYKKSLLIATAFISVISVLLHGFVDTIFYRPQVQFVFWTMVAIISSIIFSEKSMHENK